MNAERYSGNELRVDFAGEWNTVPVNRGVGQ